tara:strand:+ start:1775 stop:2470 length:696 start_codon:yes stop_codon:yes gene_type:complete
MAFNDGYGVRGKFTSNTGKKAAQQNKIKESSRKQKAETFRADEKKSLTKSIGTAGPKVRPDGTVKDDKPTAAQKEAFRQQEETYLTKSPGTVGDKYYKNPEGTGTGQGGSGIPKDTTKQTSSGVVTTATPPVETPESVAPQTVSPPQDEVIVINLPAEEITKTPTLSTLTVPPIDTTSIFATDALELDRGNQIPLLLKAFETQTSSLSLKPRLSLNKKGTFLRGFDVNFKF